MITAADRGLALKGLDDSRERLLGTLKELSREHLKYRPAPSAGPDRFPFYSEEECMSEERKTLVASDLGISIRSFSDISDAFGACIGSEGLILTENDLSQEFFDLRSGLAGELFQKFINYKLRVAIVLPDPDAYGERFGELGYEHRSHSLIRFVRSRDEAESWLCN
jgi:hypothetical protein